MGPPLSRQPACGRCGHEEHVFFPCTDPGARKACPCPPHLPNGIYPEEA